MIWQTGKAFAERAVRDAGNIEGVVAVPFISDMAAAYRAATIVVSRAGAGSISELELLGKASVLVPSPNVAEDHQTKNAMALVDEGAAIMVPDAEARERLVDVVTTLFKEPGRLDEMSRNIRKLALPESDERIADEVAKIIEK